MSVPQAYCTPHLTLAYRKVDAGKRAICPNRAGITLITPTSNTNLSLMSHRIHQQLDPASAEPGRLGDKRKKEKNEVALVFGRGPWLTTARGLSPFMPSLGWVLMRAMWRLFQPRDDSHTDHGHSLHVSEAGLCLASTKIGLSCSEDRGPRATVRWWVRGC